MQRRRFVAVVEDDVSVREALPDLLRALGYEAGAFSSAEGFLASAEIEDAECLVLAIAMPGMSGLDLQRELIRLGWKIPIVFVTAHGDETPRLCLGECGVVECLLKPFSDTALAAALQVALEAT